MCWLEKKILSKGGKEILIKAVTSAMPIYALLCSRFPKSFCNQINRTISNFRWGQKADEKKLHWIAWSKMCEAKELGGLGFKNMECFNKALLAKQSWCILSQPQSLLACVLKGKYFPYSSFLQANQGSWESWGWQSCPLGTRALSSWNTLACRGWSSYNVQRRRVDTSYFPYKCLLLNMIINRILFEFLS